MLCLMPLCEKKVRMNLKKAICQLKIRNWKRTAAPKIYSKPKEKNQMQIMKRTMSQNIALDFRMMMMC